MLASFDVVFILLTLKRRALKASNASFRAYVLLVLAQVLEASGSRFVQRPGSLLSSRESFSRKMSKAILLCTKVFCLRGFSCNEIEPRSLKPSVV